MFDWFNKKGDKSLEKKRFEMKQFRGQLLDLGHPERTLDFEPIWDDTPEALESARKLGGSPPFKGLAFHQHASVPIISEDGVDIEERCDYVVLDMAQIMHLKEILSSIKVVRKDGSEIDD